MDNSDHLNLSNRRGIDSYEVFGQRSMKLDQDQFVPTEEPINKSISPSDDKFNNQTNKPRIAKSIKFDKINKPNQQSITAIDQSPNKINRSITKSLNNSLNKSTLNRALLNQTQVLAKFKTNVGFYNNTKGYTKNNTESDNIKFYISLTTTPSRFYSNTGNEDAFMNVLRSLSNQTVVPDKIFVSICTKYSRRFTAFNEDIDKKTRIEQIKRELPLVEIIDVNDYGPATKLLGLLEYNSKKRFLLPNDLIIVVDDDLLYSRDLVFSHSSCYQLFNCDVVATDQDFIVRSLQPYTFNVTDVLFQDNYQGFLYGWLSFSMRVDVTYELLDFYRKIVSMFPDVLYHDDQIFTLYMYHYKLYTAENRFIPLHHDVLHDRSLRDLYKIDPVMLRSINQNKHINRNIKDARTPLDSIDALRERSLPSGTSRVDLEKRMFSTFKIVTHDLNLRRSFINREEKYLLPKYIPKRSSLTTVKNLELVIIPEDVHVVFTYIDESSMLMTVSVFDESLEGSDYDVVFTLNGVRFYTVIKITREDSSVITKFSQVINLAPFPNITIEPDVYDNTKNLELIQTSKSQNVTRSRFYSVCTVLNASFDFKYRFFDDEDVKRFVESHYSNIVKDAMNNLVPGAYISDIFRYCYLYLFGGVYVDCKKIMYVTFDDYINKALNNTSILAKEIFVRDVYDNMSYNAIIVCDKESKVIKIALMYAVFMIVNNVYGDNPLDITGPGCLGEAINYVYENNYNYYYRNVIPENKQASLSFVIDINSKRVMKNTYFGYYNEDNYADTSHYHNLWTKKSVYKRDLSKTYPDIKKVSDVKLFKSALNY